MKSLTRSAIFLFIFSTLLFSYPQDTFAVNSVTGLQTAIANAASGDVIRLTGNIITNSAPGGLDELFVIDKFIIIDGNGFEIQRPGGSDFRFFRVTVGGKLVLNNITLNGGHTYNGAAILNYGRLEINNSEIINNTATGLSSGGAIYNADGGTYAIDTTKFENNHATTTTASGGGALIDNRTDYTSGRSKITNSLFMNNSSPRYGGALYLFRGAQLDISNTTFYGNSNTDGSTAGGAIFASSVYPSNDNLTINNSTFAGNTTLVANSGNSIYVNGNGVMINNSIFLGAGSCATH